MLVFATSNLFSTPSCTPWPILSLHFFLEIQWIFYSRLRLWHSHLWEIPSLYALLHLFPCTASRTYSLRPYRCWIIYDRRWIFVICLIVMYLAGTSTPFNQNWSFLSYPCTPSPGYGITAVYIETTFSCGSVVMNSEVSPLVATPQAPTLYQHHRHTCVCLLRLPYYWFDWVITLILLRIWTIHKAVISHSFSQESLAIKDDLRVDCIRVHVRRFCRRDAYKICALK